MSKHVKTNIREVAAHADVSPATASRALNGNASVDAELAQRVFASARALGYHVNKPETRKQSIALILPGISNTYYSHTATGVIDAARKAGYLVNIMLSDANPDQELECLIKASGSNTAGIIIAPVTDRDPRTASAALAYMPIVVTGPRFIADGLIHVHLNNNEAAYLCTRYLLRLGRKNIAFFIHYWAEHIHNYEDFIKKYQSSNHGLFTAHDRYEGYCRALREAGLEPNPSLLAFGGFSYEAGYSCARQLLASDIDFDAVIVPNDRCGAGILNSLQEQGFNVPSQVSLVCLDSDLVAKVMSPRLTSISSVDYEIGQHCAEQLFHLINGEPAHDVEISAKLQIKNSTQYLSDSSTGSSAAGANQLELTGH